MGDYHPSEPNPPPTVPPGDVIDCPKVTCNLKPHGAPSPTDPSTERPLEPPEHVSDLAYVRYLQESRLQALTNSRNEGEFWKEFKEMMDPVQRPPKVSVEQLLGVFERRMNPADTPPPHFDQLRQAVNETLADSLPDSTTRTDTSEALFFTRPFSVAEVAATKEHIRAHCLGSAKGIDRISYEKVLKLPNEELKELFQTCIDQRDAPPGLADSATGWCGKARPPGPH